MLKNAKFSCNRVKFLGHIVDEIGIHPDPEKIQGIVQTTTPRDVGDIRRFLGTVNQMGKFSPHLAEATRPLRELLVRDVVWHWGDQQETAFRNIKNMLTSAPVLALFNPNLDTTLSADASSFGKWREKACCLQVEGSDSNRAEICQNRKGGLGLYLGM